MLPKLWLSIVVSLPALVISHYYRNPERSSNECDCQCSEFLSDKTTRHLSLCQKLARLETEFLSVQKEMVKRTQHVNELEVMMRKLESQEDRILNFEKELQSLKKEKPSIRSENLPTPEALFMKEEDMMGDSNGYTHVKVGDKELAKNVSNLFAKMEEVESLTSKVQEELKSERRVRRHLEEDLNKTRSSIKVLDDKLYNVTSPMDNRVTHVEEIMFSTLDNMNKTLFEDHLLKLYYKVDGVVYKNETKKLDERLELMETELHEVSNNTAMKEFADEMKTLSLTLRNLNQTVTERFAMDETRLDDAVMNTKNLEELMKTELSELDSKLRQEIANEMAPLVNTLQKFNETLSDVELGTTRLEALEKETSKLAELDGVDEQMAILLNVTELIQGGLSQLWRDILDNRNNTAQLQKELADLAIQLDNVTETIKQLNNLSAEIDVLKLNASKADTLASNLQTEVKLLAADLAVAENHIHDLSSASDTRVQDIQWRIDNLTETLESSLSALVSLFIAQKNAKTELTEVPTGSVSNLNDAEHVGDDSSNGLRNADDEAMACSLPILNDPHLLVSMDEDFIDSPELEFGCRPIGRYVLEKPSVPLRCVDGAWKGPFPTCVKLLERDEINELATDLKTKNPCLFGIGEFPDPTNCSYFFKCWHGNSDRLSCPPNLVFDKVRKRCDYPRIANCQPHMTEETAILWKLTPTILVEPDMIDRPYGLMGTSDTGDLIVYPGARFNLTCLFPANRWGPAKWHVDLFPPTSGKEVFIRNGTNSKTLIVTSSSSSDSGVYTCRSPFGKQNSITVIVQAVTCPTVELEPGFPLHDVIYRPHPDGAYRIMTTPVVFVCKDKPAITAYCQASGKWSRPPPTVEECHPKRPRNDTIWGCPHINTEREPELLLERSDSDMAITFKCAGNHQLIGNTYTKCYKGNWTHNALPRCISRRY